jgi:hypothetical protein
MLNFCGLWLHQLTWINHISKREDPGRVTDWRRGTRPSCTCRTTTRVLCHNRNCWMLSVTTHITRHAVWVTHMHRACTTREKMCDAQTSQLTIQKHWVQCASFTGLFVCLTAVSTGTELWSSAMRLLCVTVSELLWVDINWAEGCLEEVSPRK